MNAMGWFPRRRDRGPRWLALGRAILATLFLLNAGAVANAAIEGSAGVQTTPIRLGFVQGDVLFWRPGAGDWETAQVNVPLAAGDALATREGKLELQISGKSFIRAGDGTQLRLKSNEPDFVQLEVSTGYVTVDLRDARRGDAVEIDTPNSAVTVSRDGYYRIDVGAETTQVIVRRGGQATVVPAGGSPAYVATGEAVEISGTNEARLSALAAPPFDAWDRWNYDRADAFVAAPRSYSVSSEIYGGEELEQNGSWRYVNTYGRVWVPSAVPAGWAPYSYGRWLWDPLYGWSWVDYAPWGWAPYHYGRWVYAGYWAWAPGPALAVPVYSPALVAFFGGPGFSVGISVPFVSWVALGWGEPVIPWWGGVGFVGVPCWNGWGGPRVVNNIVINNNNVVNANTVNFWRNQQAPGAVVGVPKDQFTTRSLDRVRLQNASLTDMKPVHGPLPVANRGGVAGSGTDKAVPNLRAGAFDAARGDNAGGAASNFSRQASQSLGAAQKAGVPSAGSDKAASAFDTLRRGGNADAAKAGQASSFGSTNMQRGQAAPAVPGSDKTNSSAFDAFRRGGSSAANDLNRGGQSAATGSANLQRGDGPPALPGAGKTNSSTFDAFRRGGSTAANNNLSRGEPASTGSANLQRGQGPPAVPGNSKTGATSLEAVRRAGPGALTAPSSQNPSSFQRSSSFQRGAVPPPVPQASKSNSASTFNAMRGGSAPRSADMQRAAPQLDRSAKPQANSSAMQRLPTSPPPVNQMQRGGQVSEFRRSSSPPTAQSTSPRRFAYAPPPSRSVSRPTAPTGMYRAPSSGGASSMGSPSFSRGGGSSMSSGGFSRGGSAGGSSGGFSRGGGGGSMNFGHAMGGGKF